MLRSLHITALLLGATCLGGWNQQAAAQDSFESAVAKVLEDGWGDSLKSVTPAEAAYKTAVEFDAADPRGPLALALVQIKHRRYSSAEELIDEALELDPNLASARRAKIFLLTLTKKYGPALAAVESAVGTFPETPEGTDGPALETCRLIGRVVGYLEGPAGGSVAANTLADNIRRISMKLSGARLTAFEDERRGVAKQFETLSLDEEQLRETEKVNQSEKQAADKQRLAEEREAKDAEREKVDAQASEATRIAEESASAIDAKIQPLDQALSQLNSNAIRVRSEISRANADVNRALASADAARNNNDPNGEALWLREADRARNIGVRWEAEFQILNAEAIRLNGQRNGLLAQRQQVVNQYQAAMKMLGRQASNLAATQRRISREQEKASRPVTGASGRTSSLSARRTAFTTYCEFPLDQEKTRILESLK